MGCVEGVDGGDATGLLIYRIVDRGASSGGSDWCGAS